jgi:hypothetical protein
MAEKHYRFEQAANLVKVHGILAIVFGGLGSFMALISMVLFGFAMAGAYATSDAVGYLILFVLTVLFFLLPHVFLIISGVTLIRLPEPRTVKIFTIINLVVGVFWNLVILIFAIISLTQSRDYEEGYPVKK